MKQFLSRCYRNFSLNAKLTAIIWSFTAAIIFLILLVFSFFHRNTVQEEVNASSRHFTENSVRIINTNYTNIIEHFVYCYSTSESAAAFTALNDPSLTYFYKRDLLQNGLDLMNSSNYLVQGAIVISRDGETSYTSYSSPSINTENTFLGLNELQICQGITWLPMRSSPFRNESDVLPLVFPLYFDSDKHLRLVDLGAGGCVGYVAVLLDCKLLSTSLSSNVGDTPSSSFILTDDEGRILYTNNDNIPADLKGETGNSVQPLLLSSRRSSFSGYQIITADLEPANVKFIHYTKEIVLSDVLPSVYVLFLSIVTAVLLILCLMSLLISRYVTNPVNILVDIIKKIKNNCYTDYVHFNSNDEVGILCNAINEMHHTIQAQIVQIRHKEAEKYKTELQLLTEQINPHFLYNTLNCIQAEVQEEDNAAAAEMIKSLADYLRIGLSYSQTTISVENELRHAEAYITIMNHRFSHAVLYSGSADPSIFHYPIPKSILQPLLENSITHGFQIKHAVETVAHPSIEVRLYVQENELHITVVDNGIGFNVPAVEQILCNDSLQHIGLHNIYSRLEMFYGKGNVKYQLSSIPYFRNEISFIIPFAAEDDLNQNQKGDIL